MRRSYLLLFCLLAGGQLFAQVGANLVTAGDLAFESGYGEESK